MSSKISKIYIGSVVSSKELFIDEKMSEIEKQAEEKKEALNRMTREQLIQRGKRDTEVSLDRIRVIWGTRYELFQLREIAKKEGYVYNDEDYCWEKR